MIRLPSRLLVATEPVNLHLSFDRLAGIVREHFGGDPRAETVVVFHNRRRTHVKMLWHDGKGYVILYRRLDRGRYRIPLAIPPGARTVSVSRRELEILFEGIDARAVRRVVRLARSR